MTNAEPKPRTRCLVVSDLHIGAPFADEEDADRLLNQQLGDTTSPVRHCVLLGDIYECLNLPENQGPISLFKYTPRIQSHMAHLRGLVERYPHCTFHYVLGNHERFPEFDDEIDALAQSLNTPGQPPRLILDREFIKIGDGLFVHGDQAMRPKKYHVKDDSKYDESFAELDRHVFWQGWKDMTNRLLPWPIARMFHRRGQCARKILQWARAYDEEHSENPPVLDGIHHIFMGHTHDPFTGYEYPDSATGQSYNFYNTGASVFRLMHINRHCFNALNLFLDSDDPKHAAIQEVSSVKWPKHHWPRAPLYGTIISADPVPLSDAECAAFEVPHGSMAIFCSGETTAIRISNELQRQRINTATPRNSTIRHLLTPAVTEGVQQQVGNGSGWSVALVPNDGKRGETGPNVQRLLDQWQTLVLAENSRENPSKPALKGR